MQPSFGRLIAIGMLLAFALPAGGQVAERAKTAAGERKQAKRCAPGPGATGAPRNIEQAVDLINSLPKPVTVPCLIESLQRPLKVLATRSSASAQASLGDADPRIFIFYLPLTISVTSDGPGADLVEFSVLQPGNQRSLKGELHFPITHKIAHALPYDRIRLDAGTSCGLCHAAEARDPKIKFTEAFVSRAKRASLITEVSLDRLSRARGDCRPATNPARCALLQALLVDGRAERQDFPPDVPAGF